MFEQISNLFFPLFAYFHAAGSRVKIQTDTPYRLVLEVNFRQIVLDKRSQLVSSSGKLLARFDDIQAIELIHQINGTGQRKGEWWVVHLRLAGQNIRIGQTIDDVQASIVAAHMSKITGKPVRSLPTREA